MLSIILQVELSLKYWKFGAKLLRSRLTSWKLEAFIVKHHILYKKIFAKMVKYRKLLL